MRKGSASSRLSCQDTQKDESASTAMSSTSLPDEVRIFLVEKLAEILVLDYQASQGVTRPTVVAGRGLNRRQGAASSRER